MSAVQIDPGLLTALQALDTAMDLVFEGGCEQPMGTNVLPALQGYDLAGNLQGKNVKPQLRQAFEIAMIALGTWTPPWINATLINSWVNFGSGRAPASYHKNLQNEVVLRGNIMLGSQNTIAFILPAGYQPLYVLEFVTTSASGAVKITIDTSGNVTVGTGVGTLVQVTLEGIRFTTN